MAACILAMVGVGYLGFVILVLSLFTSDYSPVTQVASNYGVGTYGPEMNLGFVLAGVGILALAINLAISRRRRAERAGGALLIPSGAALILDAFYQTDIEGTVQTMHGIIHGIGGAVFFFTAPVGLLLVSLGLGRMRFSATLVSLAATVVFLAVGGALSLNVGGLGERILILVVFSSLTLTSVRALKES